MIGRHWDVVKVALANEKARSRGLARVDEVSFLPAAMEIVERPVSPTARATTWISLVLLFLTILWLMFGRIDVVASAQGRLIPADNVKLIQPADAGVVRSILVHDGQRVAKGQPLIELDPTMSTAEATQAQRALETAELDAARARAILLALDGKGLRFVAPKGTPAELAAVQTSLARAQLADILATAQTHMADQQAASAAQREATIQATKLTETLPLLDQQIEANEQLLSKGFVSKLKVIEMRRQRLQAARDRDIALQTSSKAAAQMASAGNSVAQGAAEARARVLSELAKADADARLRREELTKARQKSSLQRLLSPVAGTIAQLSVHTVGGVVEAAKPIMVVVPLGGQLVAEVKILNKDAGFVRAGQHAAIKLEAFPFTRYGTVPARIESVSPDAIEDERMGFVYVARIALAADALTRDASMVPLAAGMAVTADIRTGRRSIGSYLIGPIDEARLQAARER